jgi:hypothetical protein
MRQERQMRPELRKIIMAYRAVAVGFVLFVAIVAICFWVRLHDTRKQADALAEAIYPLFIERDFEGMVPYFCDKEGNDVTAEQIEEYLESIDGFDWLTSRLTPESKDNNMSIVYSDDRMTIEFSYHEDSENYCMYNLCGKKVGKTWKINSDEYYIFNFYESSSET